MSRLYIGDRKISRNFLRQPTPAGGAKNMKTISKGLENGTGDTHHHFYSQ